MDAEAIAAAKDAVLDFFPMATSLFSGNIEAVILVFTAVACFSLTTYLFDGLLMLVGTRLRDIVKAS